ncbi:MAG: carboxypeptidase regulatory-like domain-containing protein [Candidatus Eremiobacteraeota bacterium]|nr:carboxypeptidase regulatory-like domain-containing protein [Candidatus Eremiobacteraeota bacterium]
MSRYLRAHRRALAAFAAALAFLVPSYAFAANAYLSGRVLYAGKPVADASVTATGNNVQQATRSDQAGDFRFSTLSPGSYTLVASAPGKSGTLLVDLPASGASVTLEMFARIGSVTATAAHTAPIRGSGTDLTLNSSALSRSPASGSFPEMLIQLPGAARGANGVVHINGDHGDINYIVDGVSVPQALNRVIGTEFNPGDAAFVDVLQGAYPAQYGERFATVLNISTRTAAGVQHPGATLELDGGSFATYDSTFGFHDRVGNGALVLALQAGSTNRGLDPPQPASVHNQASSSNEFIRYTLPLHEDFLNLTVSHAYRTFQIPNATDDGQPASSDDNETQDDTFAALTYRHPIGDRGALTVGAGYKRSDIRDFGDPLDDWIYGFAINAANGGLPTDCFNALTIPNYSTTTCAYSLADNRTAYDYLVNADYALRSRNHIVRYGASYDIANIPKYYAVTLQPANYLGPLLAPAAPLAPFAVIDNAPNVGHIETAYAQDSWRMGPDYELDYGLRWTAFQIFSTQFDQGFTQFSPRVKFTRLFSPRASAYIYYGRFFTPFSFENVSPYAAYLLNLPIQPTLAQFDLKPQRDSDYEVGGHLPLGAGDLGLRIMQKDATDLIDDTQVGVTLLHQDINYQLGRIATQTAVYQQTLAQSGRFYVTANHTYSVNKGCETQLLAPCFGSPTDWTPADHEQRWGATAGIVLNDARGGWFSADGEYGSGLSSAACPPGTPGFCKYTPHTVLSIEKGFALAPNVSAWARITNLLNNQYWITLDNAQGNHYASGRTFFVGLKMSTAQ